MLGGHIPNSNREAIKAGLKALFRTGDTVEVRVFGTDGSRMVGRYPFNTALLGVLDACDKKGDCYVVTNPTKLPTMSLVNGGGGTKKEDVVYRRWFLLDCDAVRDYIRDDAGEPVVFPVLDKAGAPKLDGDGKPRTELKRHKIASDAECNPTLAVAKEVKTWLEGYGWSGIVLACSGNGGHLMVPCELPVDMDEEMERLVRSVQLACSLKFSTPQVKIECFNDVDRLTRAYGTVNLKGKETADRKYRQSYILEAEPWPSPSPDFKSIMLRLAAENPVPEPVRRVVEEEETGEGTCTREGLESLLEDWQATIPGFEFQETGREDGFQVICPGNDEDGWPDGEAHDDIRGSLGDDTIVFVRDGKFCFSCRHSHCGEGAEHGKKTWHDYREYYVPDEGTDWLEELEPLAVEVKEKCASRAYCGCCCDKEHLYPQSYLDEATRATIDNPDAAVAAVTAPTPTPGKADYVIFAGMEGTTELSLIGRRACDVVMRKQRWTWEGRIPEGSPTLFTGPVGKGKTMASLSVVYCVTTGHDWPDGAKNTMGPRSVLIAATEDDIETTITPRLAALGADMSRITFIECVGSKEKGGKEKKKQLALKDHTKLLRATLKKNPEIALIVLDPITGFYGKADGNNNSEVRPMIQDLNKVCQELRITIIGIVHENKQKDVSAVNQILGAGALSQVVRSGLRFSSDPDNRGGLICASIKTNLTKAGGGLRFKIEGVDVTLDNGEVTNVGRIVWGEQHELTADDVMGGGTEEDRQNQMGRPPAQTQKACELITTFWANGPRLLTDGHKVREEADISESTWKQAAKQLGLEYKKIEKDWWGRLPFSPGTESQQLWWSRRCPAKDPKLNDFPA